MPMKKEWKELLRTLQDQGWKMKPTKNGFMLYPPDKTKEIVTVHKTPSDWRSWENTISKLRKSGYRA